MITCLNMTTYCFKNGFMTKMMPATLNTKITQKELTRILISIVVLSV